MSSPYKTFSTYTFGCKVNFADTSMISRSLISDGYSKVSFFDNPNIYVINTCSVTENADKKAVKLIKSIAKKSPKSKILVTGCYAQLKPHEISKIPGVDYIIGTENKFDISKIISDYSLQETIINQDIKNANRFNISYSLNERTRAFIKIQDGCDYSCSYCTIPMARGESRSFDINKTINTIQSVVDRGFQEIVLSGINIGDFGKKYNQSLNMLLLEIEKISKLKRYRISSIEPNLLSDNIIETIKYSQKALPHFHIPLQSGSNKILKRMKRRYTINQYKNIIEKIISLIPDVSIGVDVIVGFPGETNSDFEKTFNIINILDVSYLHVFTFSKRTNTEAFGMTNKIEDEIKARRRQKLIRLSKMKNKKFIDNNIGKIYKVLFENRDEEYWTGLTDNYIKVHVKSSSKKLKNKIKDVKLIQSNNSFTLGDIIE